MRSSLTVNCTSSAISRLFLAAIIAFGLGDRRTEGLPAVLGAGLVLEDALGARCALRGLPGVHVEADDHRVAALHAVAPLFQRHRRRVVLTPRPAAAFAVACRCWSCVSRLCCRLWDGYAEAALVGACRQCPAITRYGSSHWPRCDSGPVGSARHVLRPHQGPLRESRDLRRGCSTGPLRSWKRPLGGRWLPD